MIKDVQDTFLHFIADNMVGTEVHSMTRVAADPESDKFHMNAINVQFANIQYERHVTSMLVHLDVIFDNEDDAISCMDNLWTILKAAFYTNTYNYTDPNSPTLVWGNVNWPNQQVSEFRKVYNDNYTHFRCVLPLTFM